MEQAFETLESQGKNDLDGIVQWLKDTKLIGEGSIVTEEQVRNVFGKVTGVINFQQFKAGMEKLHLGPALNRVLNPQVEDLTFLKQMWNCVTSLSSCCRK